MLGKMMIHGLVAAILVGGAAAVYAQATAGGTAASPATSTGNGYLQPGGGDDVRHGRDSKRHGDRHAARDADRRERSGEHHKDRNKSHDRDD